ncbi:increased sodium tolerance 1-like protein [Arctopsyche grandis]|uniref:increased sodium tolerance 1-like protein n=1 Tax=Arctopsyche grandis TaxID=121162 RepID=UPI00406D7E3C
MFSSSPNYTKLKTNLRLAINRLKLIEKKKTELTQKSRKEIADYIQGEKYERAKIRVEHIIREDYLVEAMEIIEMYCDLVLARFGLITQMTELDPGLAEAVSSLIWIAPRMQADIQELKVVAELLAAKYGKPYAESCRKDTIGTVSEKLKHKMSVQSPPKLLVEKYLIEIAKNYDLDYEPDPQIMKEEHPEKNDGVLIDLGPSNVPRPPGFIDFPQPPGVPAMPFHPPPFNYPSLPNFNQPTSSTAGFVMPPPDLSNQHTPMTYNIPPPNENKDINTTFLQEEMSNLPPAYDSLSPDENLMNSNAPKPQPRSKFPNATDYSNINFPEIPDLPNIPTDNIFPSVPSNKTDNLPTAPKDDIDFDDLTKRFEELKKKK